MVSNNPFSIIVAVPKKLCIQCKAMPKEEHEARLLFNDTYKHVTRIKDMTLWNQIVLPDELYKHTPTCKKFHISWSG